MNFHTRLRELREEKGITQKELGDVIGVSDRVVGYYESGRFPKDEYILNKIADYFEVSMDYLMGKTNNRNPLKANPDKQPTSLEDYIKEAESLMLFGDAVTEEDKEAILTALKIAYETAIKKNKEQQKNDNK